MITIHEGKKDFECSICGNKFSHSESLQTHVRTVYEGQNHFECFFCDKNCHDDNA